MTGAGWRVWSGAQARDRLGRTAVLAYITWWWVDRLGSPIPPVAHLRAHRGGKVRAPGLTAGAIGVVAVRLEADGNRALTAAETETCIANHWGRARD